MLLDLGLQVRDNPFKRKLTEDEIIRHLDGADGLIAGLEPLNERVLVACPKLKAIARVGIGMDNVDQESCRRLGIKVSNTPDGPTEAVVELTLAALLCIARGIIQTNDAVHRGKWEKSIGFSLTDLKVLVVGAGRIGRKVAALLTVLGSEVRTCDPWADADYNSLDEALPWAEVVSLHASGNEKLIGRKQIARMRDGVVLLNSARGGLVDEDALYDGLNSGKIQSCWLDVFCEEPYNGKLASCPRALLTPHISTYTRQCRLAMEVDAVNNLLRDLDI
ncbi:hydroxyacid dehydrogenase [Desulfovibrio sp. OttesenSCG-928-A18]|nr:hydroxyacid dehydrogenase [Desulfovibrio sp. OttesenSCG-928-A18]